MSNPPGNSPETAAAVINARCALKNPRPAADLQMARFVHDRFASFGIPMVEIQPVEVLLSNPIESSLELLDASTGAVLFAASLAEDVLDLDKTSDTWFRNHTFNG